MFDGQGIEMPVALSLPGDPVAVVAAARARLRDMKPGLVLVFSPRRDDVGALVAGLAQGFGPRAVVMGCSSAGGFAYGPYDDDACIVIAFPHAHFRAKAVWLDDLARGSVTTWMQGLRGIEGGRRPRGHGREFGLLLIDGDACREELVTATCGAVLPDLMVLGGSAAEGRRFGPARLALGGDSRSGAALFCRVSTDFQIEEIVIDHFTPEGARLVVTDADPDNRCIMELDAEPAADEYARRIGVARADLGPGLFAAHPLIETQGGRHFVRAIRDVTPDGGLALMSSVETGVILGIGRAESLAARMGQRMGMLDPPDLVLGFDCILRRVAVEKAGETARIAGIFARHRIAGFATWGEQHSGIHVNQTFVGLALRMPGRAGGGPDHD